MSRPQFCEPKYPPTMADHHGKLKKFYKVMLYKYLRCLKFWKRCIKHKQQIHAWNCSSVLEQTLLSIVVPKIEANWRPSIQNGCHFHHVNLQTLFSECLNTVKSQANSRPPTPTILQIIGDTKKVPQDVLSLYFSWIWSLTFYFTVQDLRAKCLRLCG